MKNDRCPTCGQAVAVSSGEEGTNCFLPKEAEGLRTLLVKSIMIHEALLMADSTDPFLHRDVKKEIEGVVKETRSFVSRKK